MERHEGHETVANLKTDTAVAADIAARYAKPRVIAVETPDGRKASVLVLPTGLTAHDVKKFADAYLTAPERRQGTAKLSTLESFIEHVKRFQDEGTALFGTPTPPALLAVYDYHHANVTDEESGDVTPGAPRFGTHRASYEFPLSSEWTAWMALNAKPLSQADFAGFLEDRIIDVADPDSAFSNTKRFADVLGLKSFASSSKLMTLSRGLSVRVDERATEKIDIATGERTVHYQAEHNDEAGAPLEVPRAFIIQIPVFDGGVAYQLPVRLKYRLNGGRGGIVWSYEIHDAKRALDDAFREACAQATEVTGSPLFMGSPEK